MYENFQKILNDKGISAYKVSKETGISTVTFTNWKNGKYTPKQEKMQKIAEYLGVNVNYLYGNDSENSVDDSVYAISIEEATTTFIKQVSSPEEFLLMSSKDKKNFQNYLLEQAELAYLKYKNSK